MENIFHFLQYVEKLKTVRRAGWVNVGIKNPESVADHSYGTAMLCALFARKFNVDEAKLIKMALVHDLAESVIGDIILQRGKKQIYSSKKKFKQEKAAMEKILNGSGNKELMDLWLECEEGVGREAKIVKQLDKLEMVIQALEYEKIGAAEPKDLDEFWINAEQYFTEDEFRDLFLQLRLMRK